MQRLAWRAERHHRSLQGELTAIIEAAVREDRPATPAEVLAEVRRLGLRTPSEAGDMNHSDRRLHDRTARGLVPVRAAMDRKSRRALLDVARSSGPANATAGPEAARSQDFLYEDDAASKASPTK